MRTAQDIDAQPLPGITYAVRPDATAQAQLSALGNVYRYVLNKYAADMTSANSTSVRYTEGVGDVGQRPD